MDQPQDLQPIDFGTSIQNRNDFDKKIINLRKYIEILSPKPSQDWKPIWQYANIFRRTLDQFSDRAEAYYIHPSLGRNSDSYRLHIANELLETFGLLRIALFKLNDDEKVCPKAQFEELEIVISVSLNMILWRERRLPYAWTVTREVLMVGLRSNIKAMRKKLDKRALARQQHQHQHQQDAPQEGTAATEELEHGLSCKRKRLVEYLAYEQDLDDWIGKRSRWNEEQEEQELIVSTRGPERDPTEFRRRLQSMPLFYESEEDPLSSLKEINNNYMAAKDVSPHQMEWEVLKTEFLISDDESTLLTAPEANPIAQKSECIDHQQNMPQRIFYAPDETQRKERDGQDQVGPAADVGLQGVPKSPSDNVTLVLGQATQVQTLKVAANGLQTSRVQPGEGSCNPVPTQAQSINRQPSQGQNAGARRPQIPGAPAQHPPTQHSQVQNLQFQRLQGASMVPPRGSSGHQTSLVPQKRPLEGGTQTSANNPTAPGAQQQFSERNKRQHAVSLSQQYTKYQQQVAGQQSIKPADQIWDKNNNVLHTAREKCSPQHSTSSSRQTRPETPLKHDVGQTITPGDQTIPHGQQKSLQSQSQATLVRLPEGSDDANYQQSLRQPRSRGQYPQLVPSNQTALSGQMGHLTLSQAQGNPQQGYPPQQNGGPVMSQQAVPRPLTNPSGPGMQRMQQQRQAVRHISNTTPRMGFGTLGPGNVVGNPQQQFRMGGQKSSPYETIASINMLGEAQRQQSVSVASSQPFHQGPSPITSSPFINQQQMAKNIQQMQYYGSSQPQPMEQGTQMVMASPQMSGSFPQQTGARRMQHQMPPINATAMEMVSPQVSGVIPNIHGLQGVQRRQHPAQGMQMQPGTQGPNEIRTQSPHGGLRSIKIQQTSAHGNTFAAE